MIEPKPSAPAPIGVIGGMGPHAGLLLVERILEATDASSDQEHLPIALLSYSDRIPDRTAFLSGEGISPARAIAEVAIRLAELGVLVAGIPCNTAHAAPILDPVMRLVGQSAPQLRLLHLVHETARAAGELAPHARRVGVLATLGTYRTGLYESILPQHGLDVVIPDPKVQAEQVHRALYDPVFGIKARPDPVDPRAIALLDRAVDHLLRLGAEAVILGCTELSVAWKGRESGDVPVVDSTTALARALVRESAPDRLRPLE